RPWVSAIALSDTGAPPLSASVADWQPSSTSSRTPYSAFVVKIMDVILPMRSDKPRGCGAERRIVPGVITTRFWIDDGLLGAVQASLVALPGAGAPSWVGKLVSSKWALILPGSIAVVIAGLALAPGAADGLTWLAFVAIPPLAALALGWAMRGARPWLAVLVIPLLAV